MRNIFSLLSALIGLLLVCEASQQALASAITIGETNALSFADSGNGNLLVAQNATLSQPATIQSLSLYVAHASGNLILGIYDAGGPNGGPGALKAQTTRFAPVVGWNTANVITPVSLPAGVYWLAYLPSKNNLAVRKGLTSGVSNHYYSYPFGALPATFSTSPSADPYHWSFYATLNPAPTISSISVSKSSFAAGAPSGTVVGAISVSMSSGSFTGSLSLTGPNASDFKIVGSNLETNAVLPPGYYNINIVATQSGAANSPFTQAQTLIAASPSISSVSLSTTSFVGGSPSGTVVGTINVTMSPSSPAFSGSLSLSTTEGGCTATNGANNSSFAIGGNKLTTNGTVAPGTYAVCILATETSASNSPVGQVEKLTANSTKITIGETNQLAGSVIGDANLLFAQSAALSQTATIESLSIYAAAGTGDLILGIYADNGSGAPGVLQAQTASFSAAAGWNIANVTASVSLQPGTYWLAWLTDSNALSVPGVTTGTDAYYPFSFGSLPPTFSRTATIETAHRSLYATLNTGAVSQSISSVSLSNSSLVGGSPSGTVVGAINVAMSPSSPAFSGSLSLSTTQGGCNSTNGANNSSFVISGGNLVTSGTVGQGSYAVCTLATQTGATNSPLGQAVSITGTGTFPLSVSAGKLVDGGGTPYLILGDAPQGANSIPLCSAGNTFALCQASADTLPTNHTFVAYAKDRKAQGFNSLWINIVCEAYTRCNNNGSTQEDTFPFTTQLSGAVHSPDTCPENGSVNATPNDVNCWDMATAGTGASASYWNHIDGYFQVAAQYGMQVLANPIPTDACLPQSQGGSFTYMFLNNNTQNAAKITGYADFLVNRYKNTPNLIWFLLNDYICSNSTAYPSNFIAGVDNVLYAFVSRLVADEQTSGGYKHLITSEVYGNSNSLSDNINTWSNVISLNGVYYNLGPTYDGGLLGVSQAPSIPVILVEGAYAGEDLGGVDDGSHTGTNIPGCGTNQILPTTASQNSAVNGNSATCPFRERVQFWKLLLTGAAGYVNGNTYTWQFSTNWFASGNPDGTCTGTAPLACLDIPSNVQLVNAAAFLKANSWYKLRPDYTRGVNGSGFGIGNPVATPFINTSTGCYGSPCANYYIGSNYNDIINVPKSQLFDRFVVSGAASDNSFGLAYVQGINPACTYPNGTTNCQPQGGQQVTFNNSKINGGANLTAAWYDPTGPMTSPTTTVCSPSGSACSSASQIYTTPVGTHSDGTADWVLLVSVSGPPAITNEALSCGSCSFSSNSLTGTVGTLSSAPSSGITFSLTTTGGGGTACSATNGRDNGLFTISGTSLNIGGTALTPTGGGGGNGVYNVCVAAAGAGYTNSPYDQPFTVTVTAPASQTISSVTLSNTSTTTGLASGTAVGTVSATMNPITPTFSYGGTNIHLSSSGADSGGVCNAGNSTGNGSFEITGGDTLATNGALTSGHKAICLSVSAGGVTAVGKTFTITVGNRIDAATTYCPANGGGSGTLASPWHYNCIQAAANAAATGDTVFLAAGYWSLDTDADATYVTIDKSINFVGAGSGNTFDTWGHVTNASGADLCSGATVTITCIQETGTSYCLFASTTPPCSVDPTPSGFIKFGSDNFGDTNCVNLNISHIFFDGSQATDGGDYQALLYLRFCDGVTINDIRLLAYNQVALSSQVGTETQLYPFEVKNVTMQNSVFAEPVSSISGGHYGNAQVNQPTEGVTYWGPWNVTNNVFYQQEFNPISTSNMTYTSNVQYSYNDGHALPQFFYGYGVAGDTLGGAIPNYGCFQGSGGVCNGSWHINSTNNLFYGPGITLPVGGSVNDPTTNGGLNDYNWTGNWLIADTSIIAACTANLNPPGGCDNVGMAINVAVDLNCNTSNNGTSFNVTNNSIIGTNTSYLDAQGVGTVACHSGATRNTLTNIPMAVYGLNAQHNYLQSPSNNYLTNANTISPVQQNNYCSGAIGTWSGGSACNTTGFTKAPTGVSFTLGPLGLGGIVPINNPTATAQYGAVEWLAVRCAAPCSSPPTTPLSSDSRWSSNNGSFPNSAANSYIPPVSLSGVSHGDSVYLWVMDSANHISAAASRVVP